MKTKIFILFLVLVSCTNKEHSRKYFDLRMSYQLLISDANSVNKEQNGIVTDGLISIYDDKGNLTFQKATHDDQMKAIDIGGNMEILKNYLEAIIGQCKLIEQLYSTKNLFNGGKTQQEIDMRIKLISSSESSMLKVTGGLTPKEYVYKFLPDFMKKQEQDFLNKLPKH
jgi:hypothetical protein